jgi:hypothetical protein
VPGTVFIMGGTTSLEAATEIVIDAFAAKFRRPNVAPSPAFVRRCRFHEAPETTEWVRAESDSLRRLMRVVPSPSGIGGTLS